MNASDGDPRREGREAAPASAAVAVKDGSAGAEPTATEATESTAPPISESGVRVAQRKKPFRLRDSDPHFRPLTPYQARLDVEMDDTAISKVRDPSVSIALGADAALLRNDTGRSASRRSSRAMDAVISVSVGLVLGALLVVLAVFVLRSVGL